MKLTNDYQLVSTSNLMAAAGGSNYGYYTELYAKTTANEITGKHLVNIKQMLCCTIKSEFYQYVTRYSGNIDGVNVFSGTNKPWSKWTELPSNGVGFATTIATGSLEVDCTDGNEKDITLYAEWVFLSSPEHYTPVNGAKAVTQSTVKLPAIPRAAKISDLKCDTQFVDGNISYVLTPTNPQIDNIEKVYANDELLSNLDIGNFDHATVRTINLKDKLIDICKSNKDTNNIEIKIIIESSNNGISVGQNAQKINLLIPTTDDTRPVVTARVVVKYIGGADFSGAVEEQNPCVAGKSFLEISVSGDGKYGASVDDKTVMLDGKVYNGEIIAAEGAKKLSVIATDSRGIPSKEMLFDVVVYGYRPPMIVPVSTRNEIVCVRCNDLGEESASGNSLKAAFVREYSNIPNNKCTIRYRVKEEGKEWGDYTELSNLIITAIESGGGLISGVFPDSTKAYYIQFETTDGGNEPTSKMFPIPAEWTDYQYNGQLKSWAVGENVPKDRPTSFSLGLKAYFDKGSNPIPFAKDMYLSFADDDDLLRPVALMKEFTLFIITLSSGNTYLGIRIGNVIRLMESTITLVLSDTSLELEDTSETTITHIYGLI